MSPRKSSKKRAAKRSDGGDGPTRINRLLAAAGFGSRRQVEDLIREGRVMVDGEITTDLSTTVDLKSQKVLVDGVVLRKQKLVYYAVNKPNGVVTTNRDPQGRPRVIDLVPRSERVFPVGRLDRSSEGLILLTNDGELAQRLAHPKYGVRKVYRVTVAGQVTPETMRKMRKGIYISEGLVQVDGARILKARNRATEMEITLREGKNREIRRILARFGHKVQQLRRIAIGPLRLGEMPPGAYRPLSHVEVRKLHDIADVAERTAANAAKAGDETTGTTKRPAKNSKSRSSATARTSATAKKKTAAKRSVSKKASSKRPVAGRPERRSPKAQIGRSRSAIRINLDKPSSAGAVIGGDEEAAKPKKSPRDKSHIVTPRSKKSKAAQAKARAKKKSTSRKKPGRKRKSR